MCVGTIVHRFEQENAFHCVQTETKQSDERAIRMVGSAVYIILCFRGLEGETRRVVRGVASQLREIESVPISSENTKKFRIAVTYVLIRLAIGLFFHFRRGPNLSGQDIIHWVGFGVIGSQTSPVEMAKG